MSRSRARAATAVTFLSCVCGATPLVGAALEDRRALEEGVPTGLQCTSPVPVLPDDDRGYEWSAEADLVPVARVLAGRDPIFRRFPGLSALEAPGAGRPSTHERARIVLLRDLACLEALGLEDPGADWVAGIAVLQERTVVLRVERAGASIPATAAVLRHELAHVALHEASAGRAPRWLQEGYAQLESGTWDWAEAWRLRWTFLRGSGERLERITLRFPRDPEGARLAYQLSYTAVQALWELSGERGFSAFVAALADGRSTDEAFRGVFGITESQFADRWQGEVASRYGLLYTLSRAGGFSALISVPLLWVALRRRRILRQRMDALREADRREGIPPSLAFMNEEPGSDPAPGSRERRRDDPS